jgi:hypothetical protein
MASPPGDVLTDTDRTPDMAPPDGDAVDNGVYAITRNTDYWFERELGMIERMAREQAEGWAQRGLPRHDVPRTEPLEPEQVLTARCAQLFRDWQRRVRTKMQDAIEAGSQEVGRQVATLRNSITQLQAIHSENSELRLHLTRLRVQVEKDAGRPVRYGSFINGWVFWPAAALLALVEFFANFPVFRLMLPMSRALNSVAQQAAENVDDTSLLAGPTLLAHEMLMHFEATIVALVAVVILVVLGKTLGGSLRPLLALREDEYPLAALTIRAHRRQQYVLAAASALGITLVLAFLFSSRASIAGMAAERVTAEKERIAQIVKENEALTDRTKIAQGAIRLLQAEKSRNLYEDDAAYANIVQRNNKPILGLNLGLIFTAIVLGFSYKSEDLNDSRGEHPEIAAARGRLGQLDREMFSVLQQGREAEGLAHANISRVQHLVRANPLREWNSKLERLDGVIPLFRGENARLRGLDPANISAFDRTASLGLPPVDHDETFVEPMEFGRLKKEFAERAEEFLRLASRMTPRHDQSETGEWTAATLNEVNE